MTEAVSEPTTTTRGFRLTPQQKRLWSAGDRVPIDRCVLTLRGDLDADALHRAVESVAERHTALGTRFVTRPGLRFPLQNIGSRRAPEWRREAPDADGADRTASADTPFTATLTRLDGGDHRLELRVVSLSSDLRSLENLVQGLVTAYDEQVNGTARSGEDPVQFVEYAQWLESLADDEDAETAAEQWRARLEAAGEDRGLPFEEELRDPLSHVEIEAVPVVVEPQTAAALAQVADTEHLSVPSLLSGAWRAILWWLGERSPASVAEHLDGRPFEEFDESVGRFALLAPISAEPAAEESFLDLCSRIQAARLEDAGSQEYYASLRERWSDDEPRAAVDVDVFPDGFDGAPLEVAVESVRSATEPVALALAGAMVGERLDLELRYDARFFTGFRARRVASLVEGFLRTAALDPRRTVGHLTRLAPEHPLASIPEPLPGAGAAAEDGARFLPERVAEQAERVPDRPALQDGERVLTFAALRRRTLQVSRMLRRRRIGGEDVVAACVLDPLELVPALLGILEAGAAYLPLDPTYPEERIALMCQDSGARAVLIGGDDEESDRIAAAAGDLPAIAVEDAWQGADGSPDELRHEPRIPESLAYVLYTSGSTGRPKGVMVSHGALASYLAWCSHRYEAGEGTGSVVHTPLSFDLTVTSLFGPMVSGRRVFFASLDRRVEGLAELMQRERDLSLIKITPSQLGLLERFLLEEAAAGRARTAVIGGESLRGEHLSYWRSYAPGMRLINEYGPTETVVGCCIHEVEPDEEPESRVPIGRPIDGARIVLVDPGFELVPRGVVGEIAIGGASVSRGYLGRPAQTAASFVPDPFGDEPGVRLYRTGDLGVMGDDGDLRFLGRNDRQVKLRGFRVELEEIETVVARDPQIDTAVAIVQWDDRSEGRLVTYVVPASDDAPRVSDLLARARSFLPDHMVPSAFVSVPEIPLTSHGKVDLAALPEPEKTRPDLAVRYAPPENRLQGQIVEIWQDLLQMDEVGIHDNFFDLGGHSYLMFELHRHLGDSLGKRLSMVRLFQHPTIHALAQFLTSDDGGSESFEESEKRAEDRRQHMMRQRMSRRERKLVQQ